MTLLEQAAALLRDAGSDWDLPIGWCGARERWLAAYSARPKMKVCLEGEDGDCWRATIGDVDLYYEKHFVDGQAALAHARAFADSIGLEMEVE